MQSFRRAPNEFASPQRREGDPPAPILGQFRLESGGQTLRLFDADGSVYEGLLQTAARAKALTAPAEGERALQQPERRMVSGTAQRLETMHPGMAADSPRSGQPSSRSSAPAAPTALGVAFEAAGTNRTTREWVQIRGIIAPDDQAFAPGVEAGLPAQSAVQSLQSWLPRSVLRAQVIVGGRQTSAVAALPVRP